MKSKKTFSNTEKLEYFQLLREKLNGEIASRRLRVAKLNVIIKELYETFDEKKAPK